MHVAPQMPPQIPRPGAATENKRRYSGFKISPDLEDSMRESREDSDLYQRCFKLNQTVRSLLALKILYKRFIISILLISYQFVCVSFNLN